MKIKYLYQYLPTDKIDWDKIEKELLLPFISDLKNTNQEAKWWLKDFARKGGN